MTRVSMESVGGLPAPVLPWVLGAVTLGALAFFFHALWPFFKVLRRAGSENRWDRLPERLLHTLTIGLAQTKMFKDPGPGWMHALIFWGFLVLLLRALQFFAMGFIPEAVSPMSFSTGWMQPYFLLKDVFLLLVTLACVYGLYRRLVLRPKRLTLSGEGISILVLILLITLSDMGFEGTRMALEPAAASLGSPLGYALMKLGMHGWSPGTLGGVAALAWWTHVLTILCFLNLLPRSKHFHILTALPNVFFSSAGQPGNAVRRLDFEDEQTESFGVTRIEEFSWKNLLDFHTCTECGRCDVFCPALNSQKPLSPKNLTIALRDHLNTLTPALTAPTGKEAGAETGPDGPGEKTPALLGDVIQDETVWSCTTCGACEEECPVMIEYVNKVIDLRRGLVMMEDRYPKELQQAFRSLDTHSNPWGFPADTRAAWSEGLDIPAWDKNHPTEYLYFVGCNGSFDRRGKDIARSVARALQTAGVAFSILGTREGCTGDPARRLGNEYLFEMLAGKNAETFRKEGVLKIVTHCPHCFNSLKNEYPEFGATLEVIHHSQLLDHLVREGKLAAAAGSPGDASPAAGSGGAPPTEDAAPQGPVVYHDSCYMGRHNGEYDAARRVLAAAAPGAPRPEVEQSRERGTCCGAGGARFLLEENTGTRMSHNRLDELMQTQPETIAVSCPYCVLMLEDALKAKGLHQSVRVRDIAEIIGG